MDNFLGGSNVASARWRLSPCSIFVTVIGLFACAAAARAQVSFAGSQVQVGGTGLSAPGSVTMDSSGNLYVADRGNNRVVRIAPSGTGYGTAGTVIQGLSGPAGVAADWNGNVYVADTGNNRILMLPVTASGLGAAVTVGSGLSSPMGLAVDSAGNLYVADTGNNRVVELPRIGSAFGSPVVVGAGFSGPEGVAVDAHMNLYIADTGNNRLIKEAFTSGAYPTQQVLWTNLGAPAGVAVDASFNLYIAETTNGRVVEEFWEGYANRFSTQAVLGSGFASPQSIVTDSSGNVFVTDAASSALWKVMTTSAGFGTVNLHENSPVQNYNFDITAGTTVGSVSVYTMGVSGMDYNDAGGSTCAAQTYASAATCSIHVSLTPLSSGLRMGAAVIYDPLGNVLATAFLSGAGLGARVGFIPGTATQLGAQLSSPNGVAVDGTGNVYIADTGNNRVVEVPWTGAGYGAQTTLPVTKLSTPMGLAVDGAGNLFIACNGNDKVVKLPWTGTGYGPQVKIVASLYAPSTVAVDGFGNLYIADTYDNRVDKLTWTGSSYASTNSLGSYTVIPMGVAAGPGGDVYYTRPYANLVTRIPWSANQYQNQVSLSISKISFPSAIAIDGNSNLYVLDTDNNRVLMLPWTGSGFGTQITVASGFNSPGGLAVDGNGNLYVADTGNNQVVKINLSAPGPMSFATTYLGSTSADSARTEMVQNIGNLPLTISSVSYAADFPEYPGAANACANGVSLNPGAQCQLAIGFTPQAIGSPLSETVSVAVESAGNAVTQQSIAVSGTSLSKLSQTLNFPPIANTGLNTGSNTSYGSAPVILSASASSGLPVTYQVISGPATLSNGGKVLNLTGAGVVTVQATQTGNTIYQAASPVTRSLRVKPVVLTVTPVNVSAVYGAIPASFSYTLSGFVLGQTANQAVSGKATITSTASKNSKVGSYTLTAMQGTLTSANYSFVFAHGTLTVTKATLQVKANTISVTYGAAMPTPGWTASGFVNGDSASAVAGAPAITCPAGSAPVAGKYTITLSPGTLAAANYNFTFAGATLTVLPAILTVTATSQSIVYGSSLPALTYTITGFVHKDTAASALRGAPAVATKATSHSAAGSYAITITRGTLTAANYTLSFVNGVLTVKK
jgi:sugar lactone lactonase YvrE